HVKGRFEPDKWLAADAEMVMAINVRQMLDSAVMKKGSLDELKKMVNANEQLKTMLRAVELDPFRDIDAVLASGSLGTGKDVKALVVVRGKYNLPKIHAAAAKFAKDKPDEFKLVKEGDLQLYEVKPAGGAQSMFAAFVNASTLVLTPSKNGTV